MSRGQFLAINVESLPASLARRTVDPYTLRQQLLAQHVVLLEDKSALSVSLKTPEGSYQTFCKLWARIAIERSTPHGYQHRQRSAKVDLAYRRGIFNQQMRSLSDERLAMRPLQDEIRAMHDSEWVPEEHWMFGVCSGYWQSDVDRQWYEDPVPEGTDWASSDIQARINVDTDLLF
ncbi:MAG: hypothetical protein AAF525_07680 [Pseudomonadota bacterium]